MYKITLHKMLVFIAMALVSTSVLADLPDFTQLVQKNGPAVVNIRATHNGDVSMQGNVDPQGVPEIFRRFFGPGGPGGPGMNPQYEGTSVSVGSGFIISPDGYILTNNHVVKGSDEIVVRLSDRRELNAKVVGTDPLADIALLKVKATGLPTVAIGNSNDLKPGQWVVAIGSPFDFDHSVTHGIVSYVGRSNLDNGGERYVPFIQTDVPINRGNSGGPLFNLQGQVVGINSQIYSNTGSSVGISFAIPINIAMNDVEQIKATGHVSRGMIGVQIQNVTRAMAQNLGLPKPYGAIVAQVTPGGAADKAGVQVQDVILAYNGHDVDQSSDLPPMVGNTKPGSKAELRIYRDGKTIELPVTVGRLPQDKDAIAGVMGSDKSSNPLGITVDDLTSAQRKQLGIKDQQGVVITDVSGIAARSTPLQPGDVVMMVGRKPVKSAAEFERLVGGTKPGQSVMLLIRHQDLTQFVAISVPKEKNQG